ncbi:DUF2935 domain-containing protein [Halothermothrix orenii]|uniref:DUF2935 domain-containing protein n=1 Tax=Halothermothrix orenii (strain H 168 / OCM 544 / DSM 9562) TaxID=373903 RepID=B8D258_HALOH|nr:DUF2935 domain-containing protein [Halothermothrix orenii]ACL69285.1 hypothetical protein Hore_05270 [Halothermothrix orenii H 168]
MKSDDIFQERINLIFWLRIFKEHALFIKKGLTYDEDELIARAHDFYNLFDKLQNRARRIMGTPPGHNSELIEESINAVGELLEFKKTLLRLIVQCESTFNLYPLLITHTVREADEFLEIVSEYQGQKKQISLPRDLLGDVTFWLRGMKEHTAFLHHLIDPSERILLDKLRDYNQRFNYLFVRALDLESMLKSEPDNFPAVSNFILELILNLKDLNQFQDRVKTLLADCKLLSITGPLFANHLIRETEYFENLINQMKAYFKL